FMRSMFRSVLVALVAVFAIGVASASAALPEFVTTAFPIHYSSKTGEVILQTTESHVKGDLTIRCKASESTGEITEAHSFKFIVNVRVAYTGCKVGTTTTACTSTGAATGEVVTNSLRAELVYTNKAAKEVGLVIKPEVAGGAVAEYTCGVLIGKVKLSGAVVAKLPNEQIGTSRTSFTWNYREKAGIQELTEYEEGAVKVSAFLTSTYGSLSEQTGEEGAETMTFSNSVEVHA